MEVIFFMLSRILKDKKRYGLLDSIENKVGYNRDVELSEELFQSHKDVLERSSRTYVDKLYLGAKVYRDTYRVKSLHITDFRDSEKADGIGAHLEYFNPEHHLFLHIIDVVLWHLKDKIGSHEPPRIEKL